MTLSKLVKLAAAVGFMMMPLSASADAVEDFYKDKTVTLYIGYSVGGGYDTYARLVAAHLGKHIPGNPNVLPTNMPGAGSLRLTNWLYEAAPRDGTAIGAVARAVTFEPLLKNPAATFDALKLNYIGNANVETSLCAVNADTGITSLDGLKETEVLVGGTGAGSDPVQQAKILNAALGTKMKVIDGYPGGNDVVLAMERGEVAGRCGWSWSTVKATKLDWVKDKKVNLLVQLGSEKNPELPDVPLARDLAETDAARSLIGFIVAPNEMGRPYIAPPEVPQERIDALRAAFDETMKDPEFLAAAKEAGVEINPSTGQKIKETLEEVYSTDSKTVDEIISIVR